MTEQEVEITMYVYTQYQKFAHFAVKWGVISGQLRTWIMKTLYDQHIKRGEAIWDDVTVAMVYFQRWLTDKVKQLGFNPHAYSREEKLKELLLLFLDPA